MRLTNADRTIIAIIDLTLARRSEKTGFAVTDEAIATIFSSMPKPYLAREDDLVEVLFRKIRKWERARGWRGRARHTHGENRP